MLYYIQSPFGPFLVLVPLNVPKSIDWCHQFGFISKLAKSALLHILQATGECTSRSQCRSLWNWTCNQSPAEVWTFNHPLWAQPCSQFFKCLLLCSVTAVVITITFNKPPAFVISGSLLQIWITKIRICHYCLLPATSHKNPHLDCQSQWCLTLSSATDPSVLHWWSLKDISLMHIFFFF